MVILTDIDCIYMVSRRLHATLPVLKINSQWNWHRPHSYGLKHICTIWCLLKLSHIYIYIYGACVGRTHFIEAKVCGKFGERLRTMQHVVELCWAKKKSTAGLWVQHDVGLHNLVPVPAPPPINAPATCTTAALWICTHTHPLKFESLER